MPIDDVVLEPGLTMPQVLAAILDELRELNVNMADVVEGLKEIKEAMEEAN